jgi:acyl dehydratase
MREGDALPTVEKKVTQSQIERYASTSGDFNPIHLDPEFAAASQFGGTIAHGMLVAAAISEIATMAFQRDWLERGRLKMRFRNPVYPGDTITAYGRIKKVRKTDSVREVVCSVGVRNQSGLDVITGEATVGMLRERPGGTSGI